MFDYIAQWLAGLLPEGFDPMDMAPILGFIIVIVFILAVLIRVMADKASRYNHALASAIALLFAYLSIMLMHSVVPDYAKEALDILPLIDFNDGKITLYQFASDNMLGIFKEFLHAYILSFILIGLDDLIPDAKNAPAWIVLQVFITSVSVILYWFVIKAINHFAPGILDSYAPLILGCILLFMIMLGVLKVVLSLLIAAVNPLLGAISTFFGTSPVGRALGKAAMCAFVLCAVAFFMQHSGYDSFTLSELNLLVCGLPLVVLLGLWFVVGCIL